MVDSALASCSVSVRLATIKHSRNRPHPCLKKPRSPGRGFIFVVASRLLPPSPLPLGRPVPLDPSENMVFVSPSESEHLLNSIGHRTLDAVASGSLQTLWVEPKGVKHFIIPS
jgi:hypothetical protein